MDMYVVAKKTEEGSWELQTPIPLPLDKANNLRDSMNFKEYWPIRHDNIEHTDRYFVMEVSKFKAII